MNKYLLDTNICIYFLNGKYNLDKKFEEAGVDNCSISEITVAELKFGVEKSSKIEENRKVVNNFISKLQILPIYSSLDFYAKEKVRLQKKGISTDDFDLLIGATAVTNNSIFVTNNEKHFDFIENIKIENWIK